MAYFDVGGLLPHPILFMRSDHVKISVLSAPILTILPNAPEIEGFRDGGGVR